ncbi:MAG TPA: hypothetical protein PK280_09070 [Planctomycetota bacterium]|nr:hypothetical protein [Planctomycetota bacterium]
MGFFDFLRKRPAATPAPRPDLQAGTGSAGPVDFDALCLEAEAKHDINLLTEVYARAFALGQWYVLARGRGARIATGKLGDRTCVFAFTDPGRAEAFLRGPDGSAADGEADITAVPVAAFMSGLAELQGAGVETVCINRAPGGRAFGGPIDVVLPMYRNYCWQLEHGPDAGPGPY